MMVRQGSIDRGGDHARRHQLLNRIGAQRAHGVDLLGDLHGAEFAGDAGCVAAGHQKRGQHRAQLAHQGNGDNVADLIHGAILRQRARHLHGDDDAAEKPDQNHDGKTADADDVHLEQDVALVMGRTENIAQSAPGQ